MSLRWPFERGSTMELTRCRVRRAKLLQAGPWRHDLDLTSFQEKSEDPLSEAVGLESQARLRHDKQQLEEHVRQAGATALRISGS